MVTGASCVQFEFATAARVIFGRGKVSLLPQITREFGSHALIVTGSKPQRLRGLLDGLEQAQVATSIYSCAAEPTVEVVREGAALAREKHVDVVVGVGGGSAMDAAKAIAIVATNSGEPLDYLEVVGKGRPFEQRSLPCITVPTTSGTGAEVTRNAVLGSPRNGVKASLRSTSMLAKAAIVDPDLSAGLPADVTAYTGMDTLTQLLEPFVSCRANAFVDLYCREGLTRVRDSLARVFVNGQDMEARESMSYASLLGGLSLANAGLGAVHGFAGPLGGMLEKAPHGALCAALLPHATYVNLKALRLRERAHSALGKYEEAARILTGDMQANADDLAPWLNDLTSTLKIPKLGVYGLTESQVPELVDKAAKASSMKANSIPLAAAELREIVERAM